MNHLNKFLVILTLVLGLIYSYTLVKEKPWNKYYYEAFAFYPEEFPLEIYARFTSNTLKEIEYDYYSSINISNHGVRWDSGGYSDQTDKKRFLPDNLFLEYIDLRTAKYYNHTIPLPKKEIENIFIKAKEKHLLQDLDCYYNTCMGLTFQIGIANDGNVIVWLTNTSRPANFEIEISRTKLLPKKFPKYWRRLDIEIINKKDFIKNLLNKASNFEKNELSKPITSKVQYKDSIPRGFKNLIESFE